MLISFYASFRWAGRKNYVLKMTILTILISLASAVIGLSLISLFFGPFPLLSFPFYAVWSETMGPPLPPDGYGYWLDNYQIRFLTQDIYSVNPVNYEVYRISFLTQAVGSMPRADFVFLPQLNRYFTNLFLFTLPFLFFVTVNALGALLGIWASRIPMFQKREVQLLSLFTRLGLGFILIGVGTWLYSLRVVTMVRNPPWTGELVAVTLFPYGADGVAFFIFGVTWLAMVTLEIVWSSIKKRPRV